MTIGKYLSTGLVCVLVSAIACKESTHQSDQSTNIDSNQHSEQSKDAQGNYEQDNSTGETDGVSSTAEAVASSDAIIENTYTDQYGNIVYTIVDQKPSFEGGKEALYQFLEQNLKYPKAALDNEASGTVHVTFVVSKDGAIRDVELGNGVAEPSLNKEAMRVVTEMPNWIPGQQAGSKVDVKYTIPIKFNLQ